MKNLLTSNVLSLYMSLLFFTLNSNAQNEISPYLYGVNAWMPDQIGGGSDGGNTIQLGGILDQVWDRVGEGNPRIIRIGGIVHDDFRPSTQQYVDWINAIRSTGAEPLIQVARGNDFNRSFASQAADLVNELNNVRGMDIKLWSIGNEPDLHYFNFNLSDQNIQIITDYIKEFSDAMKSQDPDIQIVGPAFSNWKVEMPKLLQSGTFDISGFSPVTGAPYIDIFDWHYYPIFNDCYTFEQAIDTPGSFTEVGGCNANWYGLRGRLIELEGLIADANARHGRTGSNQLKWGISEFNITVRNPGGPKSGQGTASFLAGQYWADVMSISAEFGAEYVIGWSIHESGGANSAFDLGILGNGSGTEKRSTFYHMKILSDDMTGQFLSSSDNRGDVKTFAVREGNIYKILVMNQGRGNSGYNLDISFNNNASGQLAVNVDANTNINYSGFIDSRETKLFVFSAGSNDPEKTVIYNLGMYENNEEPLIIGQDPPQMQSPFVTHSIPGKIQAEDFDFGGQGVAYNDTNASNNGEAYRTSEGVDIEPTSNDGGGFNVGWISTGEWTEYTIANVAAGTYNISLDVASNTSVASAIDVVLNGITIGTVNPTNTNGWQTWETLTLNDIQLSGGNNQVLRLEYTGGFNIDFINFEQIGGDGENMITNGAFSNGLFGWNTYVHSNGAMANFSVNNIGNANAAISNGGNADWNVQLIQTGLPIENGKTYTLQFDARGTASRSIRVTIEQDGDPYTGYGGTGTIDLTNSFQTFTDTFTMSSATDLNARLVFHLGTSATNVLIDNVILQEVAAEPNMAPTASAGQDQTIIDTNLDGESFVCLDGSASNDSDGTISSFVWSEYEEQIATGATPCLNLGLGTHEITVTVTDNDGAVSTDNVVITIDGGTMISNGDFNNGLDDWDTFVFTNAATGNINVNNDAAVANISNGGTVFWHIQLIQTDLTIVNGKTYELQFDARSTSNRTISAAVEQNGAPYTGYSGDGTVNLTPGFQTFTNTFTMTDPTDPNARLVFNLGDNNSNVFIDKVSLREVVSDPNKSNDPIVSEISLYPNPVQHRVFISGLKQGDFYASIYNTAGIKESRNRVTTVKNMIDVSHLSSGLHLLIIKNADGKIVSTIKFIK